MKSDLSRACGRCGKKTEEVDLYRDQNQSGQALIIILLLLIIAAIIAAAIMYRTVQDIRRTGQERSSSKASSQVESFLDVISSDATWGTIVESGSFVAGGPCDGADGVCTLDDYQLTVMLGELGCNDDGAEVKIRLGGMPGDYVIDETSVAQDDVLELDLEGSAADMDFSIDWSGSTYLEVKIYGWDGSEYIVDNSVAYTHGGSWGVNAIAGTPSTVSYSGDALTARIRPIDGDALITVTDLDVPQLATIKASCYVGSTYREMVRRKELSPAVPSIFDYVLFDSTGSVL